MQRRQVLQAAAALSAVGLTKKAAASDKDSIVIFFSRTGTVRKLAREVAKITNSDLLELELVEPYAANYSDMTDIARNERATGARREIATKIPDLSGYKTVLIGSPYWWGGLSIPMRTFLTDHPLEGKTVAAFVVSGSSSPEGAWADIAKCCPKANILTGFHTTTNRADGAQSQLQDWLKRIGLAR